MTDTSSWYAMVAESGHVDNETESKRCECINECETISFSTAISWSQMSTKTVLSELLQSSDVPERFIAATETRHRVKASLMTQTVTLLTDAVEAHRKLRGIIDFKVIVPETSLSTAVSALLSSLGDLMRGHIADSMSLLGVLTDVYLKHVSYVVTGLSTQLQDCDSLLSEAHLIIIRAQSTSISNTQKDRLELLRERLVYLGTTMVDFEAMLAKAACNSTHRWRYFPDRLLIGDCTTLFQNVNTSLLYHINWLDSFIPMVGGMLPAPEVDYVVFTNMTDLRSNMASLSKCLTSYDEELKSFEDELKLMSSPTTGFSYEPPVAIVSSFQSGGQWLEAIAKGYIANLYTKKQLAQMIATDGDSRVTTPVSRLYADMMQSLFSKVSYRLDDQETMMVTFYTDLLRRVNSLQRYMFTNDTSLEQFMRRISVWRMLRVDIQSSTVVLLIIGLIATATESNYSFKYSVLICFCQISWIIIFEQYVTCVAAVALFFVYNKYYVLKFQIYHDTFCLNILNQYVYL